MHGHACLDLWVQTWLQQTVQQWSKQIRGGKKEFTQKFRPSFPFSPTVVFMGEGQRGGNMISMKTHWDDGAGVPQMDQTYEIKVQVNMGSPYSVLKTIFYSTCLRRWMVTFIQNGLIWKSNMAWLALHGLAMIKITYRYVHIYTFINK